MSNELQIELLKRFIRYDENRIDELYSEIERLTNELIRYQKELNELEGLKNVKLL